MECEEIPGPQRGKKQSGTRREVAGEHEGRERRSRGAVGLKTEVRLFAVIALLRGAPCDGRAIWQK